MGKPRIYVDTSVIGGCFDPEFAGDSLRLFRYAKEGKVNLIVSDIVLQELERAPRMVRELFRDLPEDVLTTLPITDGIIRLQTAYLTAGILTPSSANDAFHVAIASCSGADAIVSWNFKHIVQFGKIKAYNEINREFGYGFLNILSPREFHHETH